MQEPDAQTQIEDKSQSSTSAGPTNSSPTAPSSGAGASSQAAVVAQRQTEVAALGELKRRKGVP